MKMSKPTTRTNRNFWRTAKSLTDLGDLTAQWLEGTIHTHPGYYGRPDDETTDLIPTLISVNRAGYVTISSQPGHGPVTGFDGKQWWQRAAVDGFMPDTRMVNDLVKLCDKHELAIVVYPRARWRTDYRVAVPVTASGDDVHTVFGARLSRSNVRSCFDGVLRRELCRTPQVTVIDPVWGRNDRVWACLDEWVTTSQCQH